MYLKELTLSNFRKYQNLKVEFKQGLNVLIGENDSGKTAIADAIKYLLNTKTHDQVRFDERDFYNKGETQTNSFEITGTFTGFEPKEAANFLEWGSFDKEKKFQLRVNLKANYRENRISWDLKAGPLNADTQMDGNAKELLKITYLKPLRDAETELSPGYRSRLAQILLSHKAFKKLNGEVHELIGIINTANEKVKDYLERVEAGGQTSGSIIDTIKKHITSFLQEGDDRVNSTTIGVVAPELSRILRSLSLELEANTPGLGTLNKLFMAAELLHLETDPSNSLKLCIIEELEAHLHPQAQLRVINALQDINDTQFILTTHSTTIGSSIPLESLILCKNDNAFPMWDGKTKLAKGDYKFLERFLDSTKANLFFANGVIMVEGDAENILIPTIAKLIGKPLHKHGVSIVNVGSTAFQRYAKIFNRVDGTKLKIPVSVVTDLDIRAMDYYENKSGEKEKTIPEFYIVNCNKLTDSNGNSYDISSINGLCYVSLDDCKQAVKEAIGLTTMPDGINLIELPKFKKRQSTDNIEEIRAARKNKIASSFELP
ncbi:MAG: AAA family ATPase, partial [Candidatus Cloacimonetes bacterium]|nr:AAA family ATPase [Candidatus Cloacimonadota bacterium]